MTSVSGADGPVPSTLRVAILSDTHGVLDPRILDVIAGCDLALHGGDIGGAAVLDAISPLVTRLLAVTGNNDLPGKWPRDEGARLQALPREVQVPLPGGLLAMIHCHQTPAKGRHERLRRRFPQARVVVYGHSHRLIVDQRQAPWVLNPGAAGRSRTHGGPSCLVLAARQLDWTIETYRFPVSAPPRQRRKTAQSPFNTLLIKINSQIEGCREASADLCL
jgi:uncharacterized protein